MEISKQKIKLVASLHRVKIRRELGLFAVEGVKAISELIDKFKINMLIISNDTSLPFSTASINKNCIFTATAREFSQMSAFSSPSNCIAVFELPVNHIPDETELKGELTLLLDDIQDPGNLGTIIRCADWFGVKNIICSRGTADLFNPKTIQSSMGAIGRVNVCYTDLPDFIAFHSSISVYGTLLDGDNIYDAKLSHEAFLAMGNEGNGLSQRVRECLTDGLYIPPYPIDNEKVESLNVAMATAICLAEFRRRLVLSK